MDLEYLLWLQAIRETAPSWVTSFFVAVSAVAVSHAIVVVGCALYWCVDKRGGQSVVLGFSLGAFCNQFIKNTVCCYRPWIRCSDIHPVEEALRDATGYSFPSGHTQSAANYVGAVGWLYRKRLPVLCALCWVFVGLVGFSRNYLGVHTPQDVVVALVEGIAFIALSRPLFEWLDQDHEHDGLVLVGALLLAAAFLVYVVLKPYPRDYDALGVLIVDPIEQQVDCFKSAGVLVGFSIGWFLERRFLCFEVPVLKDHLGGAAVRLAVGLVVVLVMNYGPHLLLSMGIDVRVYELVKNGLVILGATYVAPLAFCTLEQKPWRREEGNSDA